MRISWERERVWRSGRGAGDRALAGRLQDFAPHDPGVSSRSRFPRYSSSGLGCNRNDVISMRIEPLQCNIVAVGSARIWLLVWFRRRVRKLRMPSGGQDGAGPVKNVGARVRTARIR